MRDIDPEPVLAKLAERKRRHDLEIRYFQQIERWRDRSAVRAAGGGGGAAAGVSACGRGRTDQTLDKAERERLEQRSPAGARELFAFLRQLLG